MTAPTFTHRPDGTSRCHRCGRHCPTANVTSHSCAGTDPARRKP